MRQLIPYIRDLCEKESTRARARPERECSTVGKCWAWSNHVGLRLRAAPLDGVLASKSDPV